MNPRLQKLMESRDSAKNHLESLRERRDAAQANVDAIAAEATSPDADLAGIETRSATARTAVEQLDTEIRTARENLGAYDDRITEIHEEEVREASLAEIRGTLRGAGQVEVTEPTTYGKGSAHSYFADLADMAMGVTNPRYEAARSRMVSASHEVAVEFAHANSEKRERIRSIIREEKRSLGKDGVRDAIAQYEALGQTGRSELRAMDTGASSGGSFATPVYLVGEYAPYREAGRAFADACNAQELPAYGMTVYLPHVTAGADVDSQSGGENNAISESDPTAGYLSAGLTTLAGEVTVSQQLLDRTGPGFEFDKMVFDQLKRDYSPKLNKLAWTAALAAAGTVAYTDTTGFKLNVANGVGGFYGKVSAAKAKIRTTPGVFLAPNVLFLDPSRWEYISGWGDGQARPVVVPGYAGPMNALAGGNADGDIPVDGPTGYRLNGLPVTTDSGIPVPGAGADQAVVADTKEVYLFEGSPVTRAVPQTKASNLSVLLQLYSYAAVIPRYPAAVQTIAGTGMSTISW